MLVSNTQQDNARMEIHNAFNQTHLRRLLAAYRHDIVIIAPQNAAERLPACLHRYPDLPVLVVSPAKKSGSINKWLEQGAKDVVSHLRYDRFRHAFLRIIRESRLKAEQVRLKRQLDSARRFQQVLLDLHHQAIMIWQNGRIIESNRQFDRLIACTESNNLARTIAFNHWMSDETQSLLKRSCNESRRRAVISDASGRQYQAKLENVVMENGAAQLWQLNIADYVTTDMKIKPIDTDTVTGLPNRLGFIRQLQHWITEKNDAFRYVALHIRLPLMENESGSRSINRTLQDLIAYRASVSIQQGFKSPFHMGRTDDQSLTLVHDYVGTESRRSALFVKSLIGSLGGMIDDPTVVCIKTLTLTCQSLSAYQVLERLESRNRHHFRFSKNTTVDANPHKSPQNRQLPRLTQH